MRGHYGNSDAVRLRITQQREQAGTYRTMIELADRDALVSGEASVKYAPTPVQQETMRWYFEDFLKHPLEPAPSIAEQVEVELDKIGFDLFSALFDSSDGVREIWRRANDRWDSIRVEIATPNDETALTPWELMREKRGGIPLALQARSFVRTINALPQTIYPLSSYVRPLRILLVICRPRYEAEVPFRSVALRIIGSLSEYGDIQLEVLRPPTFEALRERLEQASNDGNPYHIVHFDGHGTYEDPQAHFEGRTRLVRRGYLHFEGNDRNVVLVHGTELGQTLAACGVPLLVLNACRSAFAEPLPMPSTTLSVDRERSYSSLAQEIMASGVAGVVAMRYEIRVDTATEYASQLYAALARGATLGEAVTRSRTYLAQASLRNTGYETRSLQDWFTPLVYETTPLNLVPTRTQPSLADIQIPRDMVNFPARPKAGYVGGDDTLLAIERAVQSVSLVLIHGPAGSGKTTTATEFAAWYVRTQGADRPAIFTSFQHDIRLDQVLETLGETFESAMDLQGVRWAELDRAARRRKAVKLLREQPILWVWDSVEGVDGFPPGTESHWSEAERQELRTFLRDVNGACSKIVLTSRREESNWLGDLPLRIPISSLRLDDFLPLATALTRLHAQPQRSVVDWWPILQISRGNPLMGTVLIEQVLRSGLQGVDEIATFATKVQSGEADLEFAGADRPQSLRASLDYGWIRNHPREGWKILALLHLFQGWVNVITLRAMGHPDQPWSLPTVRDLSAEQTVELLNQAADAGLLMRVPKMDGLYIAHPALPWFLKPWFEDAYPVRSQDEAEGRVSPRQMAVRAFTCAVGELGEALHQRYTRGESDGSHLLAEHDNFIRAWNLAFAHDWWGALVKIMQGLRSLYRHMGRQQDWLRLVEQARPLLCDPTTAGSLPEREESWFVFSEYVVEISIGAQRWDQAEGLQRLRLEWASRATGTALAAPPESLDDNQRSLIRDLAGVYSRLGLILDGQGVPACTTEFEEAIRLFQLIGDRWAEAGVADRLGLHYLRACELDEAERWYTRSGSLRDERDWLGKSRVEARKGFIGLQRLDRAQEEKRPAEEQQAIYQNAAQSFDNALQRLDNRLVGEVDRAEICAQFGSLHRIAGRPDLALTPYTEALALYEELGRLAQATEVRFNIALTLADQERFSEALEYAQETLRILEQQGFDPASQEIQRTHQLCDWLESQKGANQ